MRTPVLALSAVVLASWVPGQLTQAQTAGSPLALPFAPLAGVPASDGPVQVMLLPAAPADGETSSGRLLAPLPADSAASGNAVQADITFRYLRPSWSGRPLRLFIPAGRGGPGALGDTEDLSNNFAFIPQFGLTYQFADLGFGVGASAALMSLNGRVRRTVNSTSGSALLNAESGVDIATANIVEGTKPIRFDQLECLPECWLTDCAALFTLGARYAFIRQNFTASLTSGTNVASLSATQDLNAFGVTSSISFEGPLGERFAWFSTARGSVLLGPNNRSSTISLVLPNDTAGSVATVVTENRTTIVPVGQLEVGLSWGTPLSRPPAAPAVRVGPLLWVRVSLVAECWGRVGFIPAADTTRPFSDNSLFLCGVSLLAGIEY